MVVVVWRKGKRGERKRERERERERGRERERETERERERERERKRQRQRERERERERERRDGRGAAKLWTSPAPVRHGRRHRPPFPTEGNLPFSLLPSPNSA